VDFRNTVLIMTSNIGAQLIKNQGIMGFAKRSAEITYEGMKKTLRDEVEKQFRPEFINRLDDIIVFRQLTREDLKEIVKIETAQVHKRLLEKGFEMVISEPARDFLIDKGYNPDFGARPLRRAIERYIEDPLSEALLAGKFKPPSRLTVVKAGEELDFDPEELPEPPPKPVKAEVKGEDAPKPAESGGAEASK
jgi:ATP-dependent Clp protease ATP-binding subunit ClpC